MSTAYSQHSFHYDAKNITANLEWLNAQIGPSAYLVFLSFSSLEV